MLSVHSRARPKHCGRSRRPNRHGAATRPPCGRNTTLQSSPVSGCVQALVPSDSAFLSPIRSQDVQRGPFLFICGSHRRRFRVARSCTAATPPQISVAEQKAEERPGWAHWSRTSRGSTPHRPKDRPSGSSRLPKAFPPLCANRSRLSAARSHSCEFGVTEDPKYCDVIVETWQRLTGKTTCPPGSLPSGEPTPGAGATGQ